VQASRLTRSQLTPEAIRRHYDSFLSWTRSIRALIPIASTFRDHRTWREESLHEETDEGIANLAEGRVVTEMMMKKSHCVGHVFSDDCHRSDSQKKTNLHRRSRVRNSL
jgi:predicted transcriptional regulator